MDIFMLVAKPNHSFIAFFALMPVAISALAELIGQRYGACLVSSVMDGEPCILRAWYTQWSIPKQWPSSWLVVRHMWLSYRPERLAAEGEASGEGRAVWAFTAAGKEVIMVWSEHEYCEISPTLQYCFLCFQFLPGRSNWPRRCCTTSGQSWSRSYSCW